MLNGFTGFAKKGSAPYLGSLPSSTPDPSREPLVFSEEELAAIPEYDRRWAWVEIDLNAIRHNASEIKRRLRPGCRLMAVVKADAYGHGAVPCAKAALSSGAECLGVATVNEGIELRTAGIVQPILILSEPPIRSLPLLLFHKITPAVYTTEFAIAYAEMADAHGMKAPFHLAINTGMNRIGVHWTQVMDFMRQTLFHRALTLEGIFTHFATADSPDSIEFHTQARRFVDAATALHEAGIDPGIVHCDNSAALLRYTQTNFDMVRLGISLYGFHPCPETSRLVDLWPVMSVRARITDVRTVPMSEGVSYGLNYRSPGSVKICTVPLGYADGLRRCLSGRTDFLLGGQRCHQVGNICMDQCMFEVDLRSYGTKPRLSPQIGDEVIVVGSQGDESITIDDMAIAAGTIPYEIVTGFNQRLPRFYH